MQFGFQLTADEVKAVNDIIAVLSDRAKHKDPFSLNQLLERWTAFVTQVERGYNDSLYDYANELSTRDLLEEVLKNAQQSLRDKLTEVVRPWDDRFDRVTEEINRSLLPDPKGEIGFWWWFRIPKNLSEELENDLRAEGMLK